MRRARPWVRTIAPIAALAIFGAAQARAYEPPAASAPTPASAAPQLPLGFSQQSAKAQLQAEAHALAIPTPENARKLLRTLTAEPHVAGTPADHKTALFVRDKLQEWGWKTELAELDVLLNYP